MIPYGRQSIDPDDIAAVTAVLTSDWLTQGPAIPRFEESVARRCEAAHGVAVSSGTAALHLACMALDVGPGDLVWTTPISFVASANCARYCGADVDFVDIADDSVNMDPAKLADKLTAAKHAGRLPKAVIPVHFAGRPCDMAAISALAEEFGVRLIEDACHALGARYDSGEPVGCGRYADIAVTSFHPVKLITTGEGGMLLTQDDSIATRLRRLRTHGISREPSDNGWDGPWFYRLDELGYNYRITDLQAALGSSQMNRLPAFLARRHALVARYRELLADLPVRLPSEDPKQRSAWHLFVVRVDAARRRHIFEAMRSAGIGVNVHYIPIHLQPYYRRLGFSPGVLPLAERYYSEAISLPLFPALRQEEQESVAVALHAALRHL